MNPAWKKRRPPIAREKYPIPDDLKARHDYLLTQRENPETAYPQALATTNTELHLIERIARLTLENTALEVKMQKLIIEQDMTWVAVTNGVSIEKVREIVERHHKKAAKEKDQK